MPELPDVEVLRKDLEKEVVGKKVKDATVKTAGVVTSFHRTRGDFTKLLEGRKIGGVRRRGTLLLVDLDEQLTWLIDPGPTGWLHRESANRAPAPGTHWMVSFTVGGAIHGSDLARGGGGRMGVVATSEALKVAGLPETALDPVDDNIAWPDFHALLTSPPGPLKSVLMDGRRILGIGDVYSDEVLWEAGLSFDRSSASLSSQEVRRLYRALQEVVHAAVKHSGSSLDDTGGRAADDVDEDAEHVGHLRVYGREGQPCLRCRQRIVRSKFRKNGEVFHCPQCQM